MTDKLNDNDRQRIEQKWREILFADEDWSVDECATKLAEYATLFERQQQAALKELNRTLYESNERQAVVISEFKQEGSSERARANNAVGKYWEKLQQIEKLEAERSEMANKLNTETHLAQVYKKQAECANEKIDELKTLLTEYVNDTGAVQTNHKARVMQVLNSLKTK